MDSVWRINILVYTVVLSFLTSSHVVRATVSCDGRSFMINGQRKILISGSIHYPRSTPEMWPDLIQKAKAGGLDVIQTYVFWNVHEPQQGKYYFEGNADIVKFIKLVQAAGLYVHLRIGPFVCAEWNFGGFPAWLKFVPGIEFRADNGPFKSAMQGFVSKIVSLMKEQHLFEPLGGPIIMSQIENEYGSVEWDVGAAAAKPYIEWAAQMAVGQLTGVPWIMCKQSDAPDPMIDACNGFYCEKYQPNAAWKPKIFTEIWTGWYTQWGGPNPHRPAEDLAFAVARFIHNNGSFFNYYMYHGGTNFGRGSGLFVTTSYDYDAPLDEYGQFNEPKYSHLTNLHKAIKQAEPALVSTYPSVQWFGKNQEAHVFTSKTGCAAFLSNYDPAYAAKITFQNVEYNLPPWSISILPDCKTVVYNTATLNNVLTTWPKYNPIGGQLPWQSFIEGTPSADDKDTFTKNGLWDQISLTWDTSDYLWYLTDVNVAADEGFLKSGYWPKLTVASAGHVMHVFVNGGLWGSVYGTLSSPKFACPTFSKNVKLNAGVNKIAILSVAVGLANVGTHFERMNTGVHGPVTLDGFNAGTRDLTHQNWNYKVGVYGESLGLNTASGSSSVQWTQGNSLAYKHPLTWYKTTFSTPPGNDAVALDMGSMGKGQMWVNGHSIGRHFPAYTAQGNCAACNYAGEYKESKCQLYCGQPSQKWYHIPRSWLNSGGENYLAVFDELGGDPYWMRLASRSRG